MVFLFESYSCPFPVTNQCIVTRMLNLIRISFRYSSRDTPSYRQTPRVARALNSKRAWSACTNSNVLVMFRYCSGPTYLRP